MRKIKGFGFVLDKCQENIYTFDDDTVYHYCFPNFKLVSSFQSLPCMTELLLHEAENKLAALNIQGEIVVHDAKTGRMRGRNKAGECEKSFAGFVDGGSGILCADCAGKIVRLDTNDFHDETLLDLHYGERDIPWLLFDPYRMQIFEINYEAGSTRVCSLPGLQFEKRNFAGIADRITHQMLFTPDYCVNLDETKKQDNLTFFDQNGVLFRRSLPVRRYCRCWGISNSGRYLAYCDSLSFGLDNVVIYDVYQEKTMDRFRLKYVGLKCGNAFQFIHEDTKLLIATWEGVYVKEFSLP